MGPGSVGGAGPVLAVDRRLRSLSEALVTQNRTRVQKLLTQAIRQQLAQSPVDRALVAEALVFLGHDTEALKIAQELLSAAPDALVDQATRATLLRVLSGLSREDLIGTLWRRIADHIDATPELRTLAHLQLFRMYLSQRVTEDALGVILKLRKLGYAPPIAPSQRDLNMWSIACRIQPHLHPDAPRWTSLVTTLAHRHRRHDRSNGGPAAALRSVVLSAAECLFSQQIWDARAQAPLQPSELMLYLRILLQRRNYTQALQVLDDPVTHATLKDAQRLRFERASLLNAMHRFEEAAAAFEALIDAPAPTGNMQNWAYAVGYLWSRAHLPLDVQRTSLAALPRADVAAADRDATLETLQSWQRAQPDVATPYLAALVWRRMAADPADSAPIPPDAIVDYMRRFGDRPGAAEDLAPHLGAVAPDAAVPLLRSLVADADDVAPRAANYYYLQQQLAEHAPDAAWRAGIFQVLPSPAPPNQGDTDADEDHTESTWRSHLVLHYARMLRTCPLPPDDSSHFAGDALIAVAARNADAATAAALLSLGLRQSPSNAVFRADLASAYAQLGAPATCARLVTALELRNAQLHTLGPHVLAPLVAYQQVESVSALVSATLAFDQSSRAAYGDLILEAYRARAYDRLAEFDAYFARLLVTTPRRWQLLVDLALVHAAEAWPEPTTALRIALDSYRIGRARLLQDAARFGFRPAAAADGCRWGGDDDDDDDHSGDDDDDDDGPRRLMALGRQHGTWLRERWHVDLGAALLEALAANVTEGAAVYAAALRRHRPRLQPAEATLFDATAAVLAGDVPAAADALADARSHVETAVRAGDTPEALRLGFALLRYVVPPLTAAAAHGAPAVDLGDRAMLAEHLAAALAALQQIADLGAITPPPPDLARALAVAAEHARDPGPQPETFDAAAVAHDRRCAREHLDRLADRHLRPLRLSRSGRSESHRSENGGRPII